MFNKILIANRGEIACRIIKTARRMGIQTVAVHSDADVQGLHVRMADEAVRIGEAASSESYLRMDRILAAIESRAAEAVHPGYGFLSENAEFAQALDDAGVVFIGPGIKAITSMGDKIASKQLAAEAGVNTIPGYTDIIDGPEHAVSIAREIGYPVMLKASAGGGGKGMRVVCNDEECQEGFISATNEAVSSFGDERVFAEKFIEEPRHIEIQVLADSHGNTIYLGERECSIQRRHQKVIEEAPSPFLDEATRRAMGEQAVTLARAVDYRSAGTVEFIVDANRQFYFLEMNTRLQVEHPVTELITGEDLVEHMIRVAAGEELSITQDDVKLHGWALEARVYAEDPFRNFLPSTGRLVRYQPPEETELVRVDTGIQEGSEVSMFYDPMIAKLITYGETRDAAIEHMNDALDAYYIRGVNHNISFLNALIAHPRFQEGRLTTNFIAEEYPDGFHAADVPQSDPIVPVAITAVVHRMLADRAAEISGQTQRFHFAVRDDWVVVANRKHYPVAVTAVAHGFEVRHGDAVYRVILNWALGEVVVNAKVNDIPIRLQIDRVGGGYHLFHRGAEINAMVLSPRSAELSTHMIEKEPPNLSKFLLSPMPGLLVRLCVAEGQEAKAGEELAVVEAMKMENSLRAVDDVVVANVLVEEGESLEVDQPILEFE
ncbi:MAG: acetyl/propionyl/methylcrotonyl-CoA carboxylase subunit alpha [Pseudomonadales bacterium]|jgi:propionyl-CoA carboxylase alpha chain|nr:acetyl/propionyl/methylcrotonyl-CoA carboxylase subunit alpha [Pseudomonadales bacterium]MDP6469825.1 acetyl/propionyl/methylcrotonyl-CoA carboxylase subunit alpha [Pseudomonadales bacterium]MDP6827573.1 acetyl/propionyl/methylcrotonyl-CoA carboxylase subunit alpha [Pseudomonadales bacterium]MDP6971295.1 acetyl/propionyl/methylcrotonyl-CoA carboxylase subunit alpha [Pseudomonadales bacterium]|tara:strand:+ start:727 stop:2712 length:1986 start_codon:yes stop_codon:yes gene_type:complete